MTSTRELGAAADMGEKQDSKSGQSACLSASPGWIEGERRRIAALLGEKRWQAGLDAIEAALAAAPHVAGFQLLKALCLLELQRPQEALWTLDPLLATGEAWLASAWNIRARACWRLMLHEEAIAALERSLALNPADHHTGQILGQYRLALGDYERGWAALDERLKHMHSPRADLPRWQGEALGGKRLLVVSEQGLGDIIQFIRYVPILSGRGAKVTAVVPASIIDIVRTVDPNTTWIDDLTAPGDYDLRSDLMSLPRFFRTSLATIPNEVPYLAADAMLAAEWADRIGPQGFRVGIAWQGSTGPKRDDERSLPLPLFAGLAGLPGMRLISIQGVNGLESLDGLPRGMRIERLGARIEANPRGIREIAAIMGSLDLVISSDTMTAHLAGALGRPTFVGLKRSADWRWLRDRDDTPWYPTMRLFRQGSAGDWGPVVAAMTESAARQRDRP
jgi:tetratricopeptide (TPR) repeat protein